MQSYNKIFSIINLVFATLSIFNFFVYPGIFSAIIAALGALIIYMSIRTLQSRPRETGETGFTALIFVVFGAANVLAGMLSPYMSTPGLFFLIMVGLNIWVYVKLPELERKAAIPFIKNRVAELTNRRR